MRLQIQKVKLDDSLYMNSPEQESPLAERKRPSGPQELGCGALSGFEFHGVSVWGDEKCRTRQGWQPHNAVNILNITDLNTLKRFKMVTFLCIYHKLKKKKKKRPERKGRKKVNETRMVERRLTLTGWKDIVEMSIYPEWPPHSVQSLPKPRGHSLQK